MASHSFPDKLDQKIEKDVLLTSSNTPKAIGETCSAVVPSIIIHNGSPTITCSSAKESITTEPAKNKHIKKEAGHYIMSLGDEADGGQHGLATMNNITSNQRPINCTATHQSSVSSSGVAASKQNSLASAPSGNRSVNKPSPVNLMKFDRGLRKQYRFDVEDGVLTMQRIRSNPKVKVLQRSHAMREESSPPRESELSHFTPNNSNLNEKLNIQKTLNGIHANNGNKVGNAASKTGYQGGNSLQVSNNMNRSSSRHKLKHQGSSQGSADSSSPSLSRDSSTEQYTDNSGIDLSQFIADTINKNNKDRMLLLQIEQDLLSLQKDTKRAYQKFPVMPSYQRMLVHRVAAFFGMDHNVDQTGSCVIVNVTPSTRIPDIRFSDLIRQDGKFSEEPRRCILKRDSNSFEEGAQIRSPERQLSGDSRRSKSFEEREEEYERARKRIFNRDDGMTNSTYRSREENSRRSSNEDLRWQGDGQPWSSSDSELSNSKVRPNLNSRSSRITKVESFEGRDTLKANSLKGSVSKSYSFGGYPGISNEETTSSGSTRALLKQDSVTSGVSSARPSPSSSGYKSQSVRSDITASNRSSPNQQATSQGSFSSEPNTVLWAVSSINAVPPGAVLINPASGQPYTNPDGSLYRYDPENPIKLCPTIEEDITMNLASSPTTVTTASCNNQSSELVTSDKVAIVSVTDHNAENSSKVTNNKPEMILRNSSTSPSLPESPTADNSIRRDGAQSTDASSAESGKRKGSLKVSVDGTKGNTESLHLNPTSNSSSNNSISSSNNNSSSNTNNNINNNSNVASSNSGNNKSNNNISINNNNDNNNNSNNVEFNSNEVAQTNFNVIESENGFNDNGGNSSCQTDSREYSGKNNPANYHVNYASNCNVQSDYGSQPASSGAYANSSLGVAPVNYSIGPQYPAEPLHMPPEAAVYSQQVVYNGSGQNNPYGIVHSGTSAPVPGYETRPNESNAAMGVPELGNYFMGLNVNGEQAPPSAATPAPQYSYWSPSSTTSQTQGSNHSSQIQVYYVPGSVSAGTVHPKYTPAAPSMYTYNVPPMVYPTDICQSVMPSATNTVFPAPYYPSSSNAAISFRAPTPPTPTAVTATPVGATSFFLYHPQPNAPPPPPPVQFGMVRPQQQVPGIRSSPPPGPRARMPHVRSMSDRTRHASVNVDPKPSNLHFSSPLSVYGLRFMSGDIQSIGMVRPVGNTRPVVPNSNHPPFAIAPHSYGGDSIVTSTRPPKPRKQR